MEKYKEKRPWGNFEEFTLNEKTTVKIITIKPKERLSLQQHSHRKEVWHFLDNPAKVTVGKRAFKVEKGDTITVKKGEKHRVRAFSRPVRFLEIAYGKFDEKDEVRIEDDYGRLKRLK